ncbi:hypothetical protein TYRP_022750 [Tyrophagus putrescentiae]|nr:hypothetical protein TYRP_022750 [Tyrophagus putrescentiae]
MAVDVEAGKQTSQSKNFASGGSGSNPFDDAVVRRGFVAKVFGILSMMLAVTFGILLFFMFVKPASDWLLHHMTAVFFLSLAVYIGTAIPLICCPHLGRLVPLNFIVLGIFTLASSFMIAPLIFSYELDVILIAIGVTLLIVVLVTVFSAYTAIDFTQCFWVMALALCGFVLTTAIMYVVMAFTGVPKWYLPLEGGLGVAIFVFLLICDMQMMLGGRRFQYSPEDYVYAALSIYSRSSCTFFS